MQKENVIVKNIKNSSYLICDATTKSQEPTFNCKEYINHSKIFFQIVPFNVSIKVFVVREHVWEKNRIYEIKEIAL